MTRERSLRAMRPARALGAALGVAVWAAAITPPPALAQDSPAPPPIASDRPSATAPEVCDGAGRRGTLAVLVAESAGALGASVADWRVDAPATGWRWFPSGDVPAQLSDAPAPLHVVGSFRLVDGLRRHLEARCTPPEVAWRRALLVGAAAGVAKEAVDGFYGGATPADLVLNAGGLALAVLHARSPRWQAVVPALSVDPARLRDGDATEALSGWLTLTPRRLAADGASARGWAAMLRVGVGRRRLVDGREQLLLGLDVDAAGLPLEGAGWRALLHALRAVHWPGPALIFEEGGVRGVAFGW